jgi:hypothetical protein
VESDDKQLCTGITRLEESGYGKRIVWHLPRPDGQIDKNYYHLGHEHKCIAAGVAD